jgi:hypothetical protein
MTMNDPRRSCRFESKKMKKGGHSTLLFGPKGLR